MLGNHRKCWENATYFEGKEELPLKLPTRGVMKRARNHWVITLSAVAPRCQ